MKNINQNSEVWWDKQNKVVRNKVSGIIDENLANTITTQCLTFMRDSYTPIKWLVDFSEVIKITHEGRKTLMTLASFPRIEKVAFFKASFFVRIAANLLMKQAKQKNAKHFKTEKEALNWLHS